MALFLVAAVQLCRASNAQSIDIVGREFGLSSDTNDVDEVQARKVVVDAELGVNADAVFFSGLLSLYGKGGVEKVPPLLAACVVYASRRTPPRPCDCEFRSEDIEDSNEPSAAGFGRQLSEDTCPLRRPWACSCATASACPETTTPLSPGAARCRELLKARIRTG